MMPSSEESKQLAVIELQKQTRQAILDFKGTFATEEGERVLKNLSNICHEKDTTFVPDDALSSAFCEGARFVILHIRRVMDMDPNGPELRKEEDHGGRGS